MVNVLISGILRGGMYVLIALGLALVYGVMKIPNFAHGEYYLFGAYAAYFALTAFGFHPFWQSSLQRLLVLSWVRLSKS